MLWYLWSQNRQEIPEGTYSHDTALSLDQLAEERKRREIMLVFWCRSASLRPKMAQ